MAIPRRRHGYARLAIALGLSLLPLSIAHAGAPETASTASFAPTAPATPTTPRAGSATASFTALRPLLATPRHVDTSSGSPPWTSTGSMTTARAGHTATLLPNGTVLVAGGCGCTSAELYNPSTGAWTPTGSTITARSWHTATLLLSGKVLLVGGCGCTSAELYDPSAGTFAATGSALTSPSTGATAVLLSSGQVLVTDAGNAQRYDPSTGTWTATPNPNLQPGFATAPLADGTVLDSGGYACGATSCQSVAGAARYDPGTNAFTATGSMVTARAFHRTTLLSDGTVLVAGGEDVSTYTMLASAELYNPRTGTFTATGSLATARANYVATLLSSGQVLVTGGDGASGVLSGSELYDPGTGTFTGTGTMGVPRVNHTATLLANGDVLVAGGCGGSPCTSAELFGSGPNAAVSPGSLSFGNELVGVSSARQTITVTNTGYLSMTISSVSISGTNTADFSVLSDTCTGATLAPHAACAVSVSFTPLAVGSRSASVTIADNAILSPQQVPLSGTGLPTVSFTPASLAFNAQPLGSTSTTQSVTLTNVDPAPLSITSVTISGTNPGDFSVVSDTCTGAHLATNGTCAVSVRFTPSALGNRSAALAFVDSAADSPQSVPLSGSGVPLPCLPGGNPGASPYAQAVLADAPVAYWRLDETCTGTVADSSGFGHYGETGGGVTVAVTGAIVGDPDTAMSFDGRSGIITVSNLAGLPSGNSSYTVEAWIKITSANNATGSHNGFIGYGTYGVTDQTIAFRDDGCNGLDNYWWNNDLRVSFSTNLCDGLYHYVVATYDAASDARTIYLDGAMVGRDRPGVNNAQLQNFTLARTASNEYLQGSLDEPAIYNYALSPTQILAHYDFGPPAGSLAGVSPSSLAFGNEPLGSVSASQTVTLTNVGTMPLTITSMTIGGANPGDYVQTNTCTAALTAGSSCHLYVQFGPVVAGPRSATLTITDNAYNNPQNVSLSGTGTGPAVSLNPTSLAFGNQPVGTTSVTRTVTLTNTGFLPLVVGSVTITGADQGDFSLPLDTCAGATVAPDTACTMGVRFTPAALGNRSATLTIADDAAATPQSVSLSGAGVPTVDLTPSSLNFGNQPVGSASLSQSVTLTNAGALPLTIGSVTISGTDPGDFKLSTDSCSGKTIATNGTCLLRVRFIPAALGNRSAALTITDSAFNSPQEVPLNGIGVPAPCLPTGNPTAAPYAQAVLADAPVAYWRLDETCTGTIVDSSGYGRYGETSGGVTVAVTGAIAGDPDTAMSFNGTSGVINVGNTSGLPGGNSSYTLEAWVKMSSANNPDGNHNGFISYGVYITGVANAFRNNGCNGLDNYWWGYDLIASFATNLCDGAYHYAVVTYDAASNTRTIYLDGSQVAQDHPGPANIQPRSLILGKTCCNEYLQGRLDEAAIYNYALSASQILAHYHAGTTPPSLSAGPARAFVLQTVALTASAFSPDEALKVYWDSTSGAPLITTTTGATGSVVTPLTVPQAISGTHTLIAVGQSSGLTATATLQVRPGLVLIPGSGVAGTSVRYAGTGFGADETVALRWRAPTGPLLATTTSNALGSFGQTTALTFTVPPSTPGIYLAYGIGQRSGALAIAAFKVIP